MTGARSSNPPGLRLASCWDVGREGLFSQSLLSKAVYSTLFSSSPACWKSCVHWLVLLYFLSQLRDGLPGLKRARRGGAGAVCPRCLGSPRCCCSPGLCTNPAFHPGLAHAPGELRGEGGLSLASRPFLGQKYFSPGLGGRFVGHCLLGCPRPSASPGPRAPQLCDSDRVKCSCHTGLSLAAHPGDITGRGDTFTGPGSGEIPSLALGLPGSGNGSFSLLPLCAGLPPAAHPAAYQTCLTHLTFHNHHVFFQNKAMGMMDKANPSLCYANIQCYTSDKCWGQEDSNGVKHLTKKPCSCR